MLVVTAQGIRCEIKTCYQPWNMEIIAAEQTILQFAVNSLIISDRIMQGISHLYFKYSSMHICIIFFFKFNISCQLWHMACILLLTFQQLPCGGGKYVLMRHLLSFEVLYVIWKYSNAQYQTQDKWKNNKTGEIVNSLYSNKYN